MKWWLRLKLYMPQPKPALSWLQMFQQHEIKQLQFLLSVWLSISQRMERGIVNFHSCLNDTCHKRGTMPTEMRRCQSLLPRRMGTNASHDPLRPSTHMHHGCHNFVIHQSIARRIKRLYVDNRGRDVSRLSSTRYVGPRFRDRHNCRSITIAHFLPWKPHCSIIGNEASEESRGSGRRR